MGRVRPTMTFSAYLTGGVPPGAPLWHEPVPVPGATGGAGPGAFGPLSDPSPDPRPGDPSPDATPPARAAAPTGA